MGARAGAEGRGGDGNQQETARDGGPAEGGGPATEGPPPRARGLRLQHHPAVRSNERPVQRERCLAASARPRPACRHPPQRSGGDHHLVVVVVVVVIVAVVVVSLLICAVIEAVGSRSGEQHQRRHSRSEQFLAARADLQSL
ncbi:MAG: hypothetical protein BJ554DRAFT_6142, partial [Olpidium bornovanus]